MTGGEAGVVEVVVGLSVIIVAVVALVVPRRLASVVSFLVLGVLLSVLWALAGAPDVALAEAALGAGVTGVLFVDTVTRGSRTDEHAGPTGPDVGGRGAAARSGGAATVVVAAALAAGLAPALRGSAQPLEGASPGLSEPVAEALPSTGVEHGVTGVLLNLRSYDTLLEMAVLLAAVLVVLSLSRPRHGSIDLDVPPLQRTATALLVPVLVLLAAWVLLAGSTRPGGAFQSGAVLTGLVLLLHLAGRPVLPPARRRSAAAAATGLLAFVLVAAVGPLLGGAWLQLDPVWAGPLIVGLESLLAVSIGASLAVIGLALRGEPAR